MSAVADDKTAAERAAEIESLASLIDRTTLAREGEALRQETLIAVAVAILDAARPVLTREQIARGMCSILCGSDAWDDEGDVDPVMGRLDHGHDREAHRRDADALLAQGDVPAQTTEPTVWRDPADTITARNAREAAIRADQRERDAQIAETFGMDRLQYKDHLAAAIREGNNHA